MQLYIIRHAQSTNNARWLETRSSLGRDEDPGLTEIGKKQAQILGEFLSRSSSINPLHEHDPRNQAGFDLTHLYCSLMLRSVQTGTELAKATGLPLEGWVELHETGGMITGDGEMEPYRGIPGKPRSYFEENYPDLILPDGVDENGWWNRPFEGEEERPLRAQRVIQKLITRHGRSTDRIAIVTHGAFSNYLIRGLIGLTENASLWFDLSNASITRVDFIRDRDQPENIFRVIFYMNRLDFMPNELITP
jgi:2,3-bisphosphoglycerate-dependent phosphoglycerate mutase